MATREDFTETTKRILAARVNYRCSNPSCRRSTSGPHTDPNKVTLIGEAAHIIPAAYEGQNAPRYGEKLEDYRIDAVSSIENAIWLCSDCHTLIDKDPARYPVSDLLDWKKQAEALAAQELEGRQPQSDTLQASIDALTRQLNPSITFQPLFQNFLSEYLGASKKKVPFGGRQAELETLDHWLLDPDSPPYALIAAPAGRGKTALLVHWAQHLSKNRLAHVVFIPISIRFSTNSQQTTFSALAAGLAQIFGETINLNLSADQLHSLCLKYLSQSPPTELPLLIILDGLDEASDWHAGRNLFPFDPPAGLRAIVSARYLANDQSDHGWLRRLGWESHTLTQSIPLPALTRQGILDVLAQMGDPLDKLVAHIDLIGELFRLTQGDPLMVRLYVEALLPYGDRAPTLRPENLPAIQAGLDGYFTSWLEDQRSIWGSASPLKERHTQEVLNLLACSFGPLTRLDILELAGPDSDLSSIDLEDCLQPLHRFIIGDGVEQGYIFSHPRLGAFFYDKLTPRERLKFETKFLSYGRLILAALNSGQLDPQLAPAYCIRNYAAHLERSHAPREQFSALVSKGWLEAWYALEGAYSGFLSDVARAWQKADHSFLEGQEISHLLVEQFRCALCQSSVVALSSNIPPELLAMAVQSKIFSPTQTLVYTSQISDEDQRSAALVAIAPFLGLQIMEALSAARAIKDEGARARALSGLAPHLPDELQGAVLQKALSAAWAIKDEDDRAEALSGLAPHLPDELKAEALAAARSIKNVKNRAQALSCLIPHLPHELKGAALQEALSVARAIRDEYLRAVALSGLAPHLPDELKVEALQEALSAARAIRDEGALARALSGLAPHLPDELKVEALQEALSATRAIRDEGALARALSGLAPHLPEELKRKALQEALSAARAIEDESARAQALSGLAPHLPDELQAEALSAARAIKDEDDRAYALSLLAPHLPDELKVEALQEALSATRAIGDEYPRAVALSGLAPHLPDELKVEALQEALSAARAIRDADDRAVALSGLAQHLPDELKVEALQEALSAARAISDAYDRARALGGLASHLADELKGAALQEALSAARAIGDERHRVLMLSGLAQHLPDELKGAALQEALSAAWAIGNELYRAEALSGFAPHLPDELQAEALSAARAIEDEYWRAQALSGLAPHLPDELKGAALSAVRAIGDEWYRAYALSGLAPYLPEELKAEALSAVRAIEDEYWRAQALSGLAPHLPDELQAEALSAARAIEFEFSRADALSGLASHLPDDLQAVALTEALSAARAIGDEDLRARALSWLASNLPDELKAQALPEALVAARAIVNEGDRAQALSRLAPHLPNELKAEALTEALSAARSIGYERTRAEALSVLVPYLPVELKGKATQETLAAARAIGDEYDRAEALGYLTPILLDWSETDPPAAAQAWIATLHELSRYPRPDFLKDLSILLPFAFSLLPESDRPQAAAGIFHFIQEITSWWP